MPAPAPRIAILVAYGDYYLASMLRGMIDYAALFGPWTLLVDAYTDITWEELEAGVPVDGIVTYLRSVTAEQVTWLLNCGIPVVNGSAAESKIPIPHVMPDDHAVGRLVGQDLLQRGFRHFGSCIIPGLPFALRRAAGLEEAVAEVGFTAETYVPAESWWTPEHQKEHGHQLEAWLHDLPKPVGVLACTDEIGRRVLLACRALGLHVPEEVAVIGVDNHESLCEIMDPPLSSVPLDIRRAGYETAALLARMMAGETPPTRPLLIPPLPLVVRRSSDTLAVADEDVAAAMRFIWQHADEPIGVPDVLAQVSASRRRLERRFKTLLGRTLLEEIWRVHVDRAKKWLAETNWAMPRVAERSGFKTAKALATVFRRETGLTPTAYRGRFGRK